MPQITEGREWVRGKERAEEKKNDHLQTKVPTTENPAECSSLVSNGSVAEHTGNQSTNCHSLGSRPRPQTESSKEQRLAEPADVSEGESSSVDDFQDGDRRPQEDQISVDSEISAVVAAAKADSEMGFQKPAPMPPKSIQRTRREQQAGQSEPRLAQLPTPIPSSSPKTAHSGSLAIHADETDDSVSVVGHIPNALPRFRHPNLAMSTASHAANSPSEDRSASLVNILLQPLPPNYDSETQLRPLEKDYSSLIRLNLWSVIDGHGGGCVATYASEVLLPHIATSISRALNCVIVSRGVCSVNGQLRNANAMELDGLIKASGSSPTCPNSVCYRSRREGMEDEDEGTTGSDVQVSPSRVEHAKVPSVDSSYSNAAGSVSLSSAKASGRAVSPSKAAPVGSNSPGEVAAVSRAITESFLAVDEGWINSINPKTTQQTGCQSNGRWNSGACALAVVTTQRLEWTRVSEAPLEKGFCPPAKKRTRDTSKNKEAARQRGLDHNVRERALSSASTISSASSLATTEDKVAISGLESEITETEGEEDEQSMNGIQRRRDSESGQAKPHSCTTSSLIGNPGGCSCHGYRAGDALLYTAHVGDCRAMLLGSAPPRTIKVHGTHSEDAGDEANRHSSDEAECLSSSDHDGDSSEDDDDDVAVPPSESAPVYLTYMRRPARRQRRKKVHDEFGLNVPFVALPPLVGHGGTRTDETASEGGEKPEAQAPSASNDGVDKQRGITLASATQPIDLTTDHSAYNPAEVAAVLRRCKNAPRAISVGVGGGIKRVAGSLAVTRALGDAYLKTPTLSFDPYKRYAPYITATPEISCRPISKDNDKVLILATDGVWERASGEDVLRWVKKYSTEEYLGATRRSDRELVVRSSGEVRLGMESVPSNGVGGVGRKRERAPSSIPAAKHRKLESGRRVARTVLSSQVQGKGTAADMIVCRVLQKVQKAQNMSTLHALVSLPPGRARRSRHDDITACVVDLSEFIS